MGAIASQITSLAIVYSSVYSGANQRKHHKLRVTGLCVGSSPGTDEFPAQMASNTINVSIWWRHHEKFGWRLGSTTARVVSQLSAKQCNLSGINTLWHKENGRYFADKIWNVFSWTKMLRRHFSFWCPATFGAKSSPGTTVTAQARPRLGIRGIKSAAAWCLSGYHLVTGTILGTCSANERHHYDAPHWLNPCPEWFPG